MSLRPPGLFDQEIRQRKLEALGDPLAVLDRIVPLALYRQTLETMRPVHDPRMGGRPPHNVLRMFKALALRELGSLSDEQVAYQIAGRLSC